MSLAVAKEDIEAIQKKRFRVVFSLGNKLGIINFLFLLLI
jgi:hypothetical protein